ncbi:hypothetical protein Tco_1510369, partial [Tanacetum coccineum]
PESFEEAIREESWKKAIEDEIQVIEKNNTWELTDKPSDKDVIGVKWVYKVKYNADVARMDTVRAIISLAGQKAWYSQIDGYFEEKGFDQSKIEPTLYVKNQGTSDILIVVLYVDDLVFTGNTKKMIEDFKNEMRQR